MFMPSIFNRLYDLGYQRNPLQAIGFYIAGVVTSVMVGAVAGVGLASIFGEKARADWHVDYIAISILCVVLTFFIIKQKNLTSSLIYTFLPIISAALALLTGPLGPGFGLIIPTILTTKPKTTPTTSGPSNPQSPPKQPLPPIQADTPQENQPTPHDNL